MAELAVISRRASRQLCRIIDGIVMPTTSSEVLLPFRYAMLLLVICVTSGNGVTKGDELMMAWF